jgi:hypothetical protein
MRRLVLAVVASSLLFTASRSQAQTTDPTTGEVNPGPVQYTFDYFTFSRGTMVLAGTSVDPASGSFQTVYLTVNASTVFSPTTGEKAPGPPGLGGLFTAWDALQPIDPSVPPDPFYGLLVALGRKGARALVTTIDGVTVASFQPL